MARLTYLEVVFPGHIGIDVILRGAIDRGCLALQWRLRAIMLMVRWPFPVVHLDRSREEGSALNEGH